MRRNAFYTLITICVLLAVQAQVDDDASANADDDGCAESSSFAIPYPFNLVVILLLVVLSAMFSGLTLGLLGLDKIGLQIVIGGDDPVAANYAKAILPVRENGNVLLCTLLLGNVAVNSMLSILMADMTSGLMGFLLSTVMIVIFGEIIPQASCSRHPLLIGYYSLPLVKTFIAFLYILAWPLGYVLDKALGDDIGTLHSKTELRKMLEIHVQHGAVDVDSGGVMDGALKFKDMNVTEAMTPSATVFMLSMDDRFDYRVMSEIYKAGCSRIPVYGKDKNDIVGIILVKDLLFIDVEDEIPIRTFMTHFGRTPHVVWPEQTLGEVLKQFRQGTSHMAIVRDVNSTGAGDPFYEFKGIITLEDIIEEILGQEINDETDVYVDANNKVTEVENRNIDFARLKLLHGDKITDTKLEAEEVSVISAYLLNNAPGFEAMCSQTGSTGVLPSNADVRRMVEHCKVVETSRVSNIDQVTSGHPNSTDVLYTRGIAASSAILLLSGKIIIQAGRDGFRSELGPWTMLSLAALSEQDYASDYTAYVASETVRYLRINSSNISVLHNGNPSKSRKRLGSNGSNHDGLSGRLSGGSAAALGSTVTSVPTVAPAFNVTQSLLSMTGLSSRPITLTTSRPPNEKPDGNVELSVVTGDSKGYEKVKVDSDSHV